MYGHHRALHGRTHSCPTRRSSDVIRRIGGTKTWHARSKNVVLSGDRHCRPMRKFAPPSRAPNPTKSPTPTASTCSSPPAAASYRSEEHTSELQSLMRISYAVFCLKKKKTATHHRLKPTKHT